MTATVRTGTREKSRHRLYLIEACGVPCRGVIERSVWGYWTLHRAHQCRRIDVVVNHVMASESPPRTRSPLATVLVRLARASPPPPPTRQFCRCAHQIYYIMVGGGRESAAYGATTVRKPTRTSSRARRPVRVLVRVSKIETPEISAGQRGLHRPCTSTRKARTATRRRMHTLSVTIR
eukprot:scaffold7736_cov37-Prasinocladus_malaysianus.AAC.2